MSTPTYNHGPGILEFDDNFYYAVDGIQVQLDRRTFEVESDLHGKLDDRLASQIYNITITPVGMIASMAQYFPYGVADIGNSILTGPLKIHTKAGQLITFPRAGIMSAPQMNLRAGDRLFEQMTFVAIGKASEQPTTADHYKAITTQAFTDDQMDETTIKNGRYTAAVGSELSPFDAIISQEGFALNVEYETQEILVDNFGVADIVLASIAASCSFIPANLSEAEVDTLVNLGGSGALLPGQSVAKDGNDLVIADASVFSATLHDCGFSNAATRYQTGQLRTGEVTGMTKRTFTSGSANPLWTFTIPA